MAEAIYLDHAATTPVHPQVAEYMYGVLLRGPGNASSMHGFGRSAKAHLNAARDTFAGRLAAHPSEFVFTSGGTESDNLALFGAARAMRRRGRRGIVTTAAEHHAVLHACEALAAEGFDVTVLPVDAQGRVSLADAEQAIGEDTAVVSVMWGNNETGTIQPIEAIGAIARDRGALFHVDAVQALGALPIALDALPVDLMSFSSHKINGPQGVGALYIRKGTPFEPLFHGGSQERKRRAGTENIAGIAGFAKALDIAAEGREAKNAALAALRDSFERQLAEQLGPDGLAVNGDPNGRLPHISNVSLLGTDTETMLMRLDLAGVAAASGSACTSGALERSHVLRAMGLPEERLRSAVRFSFGLGNTAEEIGKAANLVATAALRIRSTS